MITDKTPTYADWPKESIEKLKEIIRTVMIAESAREKRADEITTILTMQGPQGLKAHLHQQLKEGKQ